VSGWTDANAHDPGIALLQGLVWWVAGFAAAGLLHRLVRRRDP
jgi:hypothetical protein